MFWKMCADKWNTGLNFAQQWAMEADHPPSSLLPPSLVAFTGMLKQGFK